MRKSDGKELCLKIQYPGVADAIDSDMRALVRLLKLSRLVPITEQFNMWLDEVREMLAKSITILRLIPPAISARHWPMTRVLWCRKLFRNSPPTTSCA